MTDAPVEVKRSPPLPRSTMAPDVWQAFRDEIDRLFNRWSFQPMRRMFDLEPFRFESSFGVAAPAVDVTEDDKTFKISAELPGLNEKDIEINVTGDMIMIKGEKRQEREEKEKNRYFSERRYGSFQRAFEIPDSVDRDKIAAEFSKGVLTLTLPKTADAQKQQKKIEVNAN